MKSKKSVNQARIAIMTNESTQDYWDDDHEGHVDTRHFNHECENPDPKLGCNLGSM
jgi:hypothetical protein